MAHAAGRSHALPAAVRATLETLAPRFAPLYGTLDDGERGHVWAIVAEALGDRPAATRRQLALFLFLVRWLPCLRHGRPFGALPAPVQDAFLAWLQDAPLTALRQGRWGVKTLVFMGVYGRPEAGPALHYTPSLRGNDRLRSVG